MRNELEFAFGCMSWLLASCGIFGSSQFHCTVEKQGFLEESTKTSKKFSIEILKREIRQMFWSRSSFKNKIAQNWTVSGISELQDSYLGRKLTIFCCIAPKSIEWFVSWAPSEKWRLYLKRNANLKIEIHDFLDHFSLLLFLGSRWKKRNGSSQKPSFSLKGGKFRFQPGNRETSRCS